MFHKGHVWHPFYSSSMHPNYLGWLRISFHTNVATRTTRRYILSFKPSNSTSEEDAMRVMECCIKKIWRWRIQDRLLVNDDKTEFRIIGTRQQFRKLQAINIKVGSSEKKKTKVVGFKNVMERSRARHGSRFPMALALLGICDSSSYLWWRHRFCFASILFVEL